MREFKLSNKKDPIDVLDYKEPICKIYFVRHGQTNANKNHLLFGHLDYDLNKQGIKDANLAAKKLAQIVNKSAHSHIDYIVSSPLKRAKHTAKVIAKRLSIKKFVIDKNLIEKSEGLWEGKSFWEVREKDKKNYLNWIKNPFFNKPPKGESVNDLNARVKKFHQIVLKKYLGKNVIVVSHSGPIRLFILNLLGADIKKFWYLKTNCGSITEVNVSKKHSLILI